MLDPEGDRAFWQDGEVVKYRRPIALALGISGVACATLAIVDVFNLAVVPGGRIFGVATWFFIGASWLFMDISSRWRTPKVTKLVTRQDTDA